MATGTANANAKAASKGASRLGAERAAFLEALKNLKSCLGDGPSKVTGWTISEVRYFDSDPVVEVDVAASTAADPKVTILGSGIPNLGGASVGDVRVKTTRSATLNAQRNAKEALDVAFPNDGAAGETKKVIAGTLKGCATTKISYWDDQAVTVTLECGKGVDGQAAAPKPTAAPALEKHAAK
jgi:hypothetical protein